MRRRRILLVGSALALLLIAAVVMAVVARGTPTLVATGPTGVEGTEASAVFTVAERTVRQVRYADQGTLRYTFALRNDGRLPVRVVGLAAGQDDPRLFDLSDLTATTVGAGASESVTLALDMGGCESLSSRAGSFVSSVGVRVERLGLFTDTIEIALPEELHTGSPREAFCPQSTATSRPPG